MFGSMGQTNVKNLGNGGTMDGDVTITGDLTVSGGIGLSLSEVIEGTSTIDVTNTEALLVRKNGDGGDLLIADTTNMRIGIGKAPDTLLHLYSTSASKPILKIENEQGGANPVSIQMLRNTSSPADDDFIGQIDFRSMNDAGTPEEILYAYISAQSTDITDGTEDGEMNFHTMKAGTLTNTLELKSGDATFSGKVKIDQDSNNFALEIDSENTTANAILVECDALTSNGIARFYSNSSDTSSRGLVQIVNNHASATGAVPLKIEQNSTGYALNAVSASAADVTVANFQSAIDANGEHSIIRVGNSGKGAYMGLLLNSSDTAYFGIDDNPDDGNGIYVNESAQIGIGTKAPSGILDVRANSSKVGFGTDSSADFGEIYFASGVAINFAHETNGNAGGVINFRGYDNGTSQFRDLTIADGKGNTVAFFDGSTARMGIGTDSPQNILHLSDATPALLMTDEDDNSECRIVNGGGNLYLDADLNDEISNSFIALRTDNGSEKMRVTSTGRVGIGTSSPASATGFNSSNLTIHGSDPSLVISDSGQDNLQICTHANAFKFINDSDDRAFFIIEENATVNSLYIDDSGHIGINNSSPTMELEIYQSTLTHGSNVGIRLYAENDSGTARDGHILLDPDTQTVGFSKAGATVDLGVTSTTVESIKNVNIDTGGTTSLTVDGNNTSGDDGRIYLKAYSSSGSRAYININNGVSSGGQNWYVGALRGSNSFAIGRGDDFGTNTDFYINSSGVAFFDNNVEVLGQNTTHGASRIKISQENTGLSEIRFYGANTSTAGSLRFISSSSDGSVGGTRMIIDNNSKISLSNNDSGTGNTIFGKSTATSLDAGSNYNVLVGASIATGTMNDATHNVAVGSDALQDITSGDDNIAIGSSALLNITTGSSNVVIGRQSGDAVTSQSNLVLVGKSAGGAINHNDANGSVAVGASALAALTSGAKNIAIGFEAMNDMQTGTNNIALGYQAMDVLQGGDSSGGVAASANGGNHNIAIGTDAMGAVEGYRSTTEIDGNIAIGTNALLGGDLLNNNIDFVGNIAIGYNAVDATGNAQGMTGTIGIGYEALSSLTSGARNTAVGFQAMDELTTGEDNVAFGYGALGGASTSSENKRNVAIGNSAMSGTNAGASQNVAVGYAALDGNLTSDADNNIAIGYYASSAITSGNHNVAIGANALLVEADGDKSVAIGHEALTAQTGTNGTVGNTAVGHQAGSNITTGIENTIVGSFSTISAVNGQNQTIIGGGITGNGNNSVVLGNTSVTDVYMAKDSGATVHCANINLGGVASGGSGNLDDYEEGTGSPTVSLTGSGSVTLGASAGNAWTKVGNIVHFQFEFSITGVSSPVGALTIALPFTSAGTYYSAGSLRVHSETFDGSPFVAINPSSSVAQLKCSKTGSSTTDITPTAGTRYFFGQITYRAA